MFWYIFKFTYHIVRKKKYEQINWSRRINYCVENLKQFMLKVYILYSIIPIVVRKTFIFKVQIPVIFFKHSPIHFCIKLLTRFIHFFLLIEEFTFILIATIQYNLYVHMSVFVFRKRWLFFSNLIIYTTYKCTISNIDRVFWWRNFFY